MRERSRVAKGMSTYEMEQPWVAYHYGATHDRWWPFWSSTRVLGYAIVVCECAVCGEQRRVKAPIPRFGDPNPGGGKHPERIRFLLDHIHPDRPHPMSWAKPLLNPGAHRGGMDLDLLAMRLEADLRRAALLHRLRYCTDNAEDGLAYLRAVEKLDACAKRFVGTALQLPTPEGERAGKA
jgi:hypothetical protein